MDSMTRREAMKLLAGTGFSLAAASALAPPRAWAAPSDAARASADKKIRLGFIGVGDRGTGLLHVALAFPYVEVPAVCDIDHRALTRAQGVVEKARGKKPDGFEKDGHDYRRLLARDDVDAVIIATPQELHAEQVIDSLNAKKFTGSEVPACVNLDECWALVRAQRQTGTGYMMLENYLYSQPVMMVQNMVRQGVFGDLTYGFGSYIHEIREMRFKKDGSLTWRGENVLHNRGIVYPTHAIGPVCRWMGINVDDRLETLVAMDSKPAGNHVYAAEKFGEDSGPAKVNFENGDTNQCLIRTKQGRLIEVRYDTASPRPSGMGQYSLQGTKASFESALGERKIYIEGKTKPHTWEDLDAYRDQYNHPYWSKRGDEANKTGHGGGDYFVISDFLDSVRTGKPAVDMIDAVTWSCVRPLSEQSIREGNKPMKVPEFSKV